MEALNVKLSKNSVATLDLEFQSSEVHISSKQTRDSGGVNARTNGTASSCSVGPSHIFTNPPQGG
jgi:hypothetical protein